MQKKQKLRPILYFMFKKDLAKKYQISTKTLNRWINAMPALKDTLKYYGYEERDKVFTPKQIEIIFDYIGLPPEFEIREKKFFPVRPYSKRELLDIYRVTYKTFYKYLARNPELFDIYNYYKTIIPPDDVKRIFNFFGHPFF